MIINNDIITVNKIEDNFYSVYYDGRHRTYDNIQFSKFVNELLDGGVHQAFKEINS